MENNKQILRAIAEVLNQPQQIRDEDDWLVYVATKAREVSKSPNPVRRRQPKVTRLASPRQRQALKQTNNPFKAGMMSAEEAQREWDRISDEQDETTRNVGPNDLPIRYSHGKETGYRSAKDH